MSAVQYPFIDVAVAEPIRLRFASGEGLVLFSSDMRRVLWANGEGAALFGFGSIYDLIEQGPRPTDMVFRQTQAVARQLAAPGQSRALSLRIHSGFQRIAVAANCSLIEIFGEQAILIALPSTDAAVSTARRAALMIEGFDEADMQMAVIDADGGVLASSARFRDLSISPDAIRSLQRTADTDPHRLAKRPVPTDGGHLPTAVGKVSDDPALYLIFAADLRRTEPVVEAVSEASPADPQQAAAILPDDAETPPEAQTGPMQASDTDAREEALTAVANIEEAEELQEEISLSPDPVSESTALHDENDEAQTIEADALPATPAEPAATPAELPEQDPATPAIAEDAIAEAQAEALNEADAASEGDVEGFRFRQDGRALRFVWKIDASGRFTEISKEFAEAVGPHAAAVVGMPFSDLAALFHLDPEGRLGELLNKRDTWSGKTIWWPVEGTSLIVPVDLAALPTYTRSREFDGFRGFGIVRIADALDDPHAVGLSLSAPPAGLPAAIEAAGDIGAPDAIAQADEDGSDGVAAPDMDSQDAAAPEPDAEHDGPAAATTSRAEPASITVTTPGEAEPVSAASIIGQLKWPDGERPALRLVENAGRRTSDKMLQIAAERPGLSPGEQATFREIARQLDGFVNSQKAEPGTSEAIEAPEATEALRSAEAPGSDRQAVEVNGEHDAGEPSSDTQQIVDAGLAQDEIAAAPQADASQPVEDAPRQDAQNEHDDAFESAEGTDMLAAGEPVEDVEDEPDAGEPVSDELDAQDGDRPIVAAMEDADDTDGRQAADLADDRALLASMLPMRERIGLTADILDQMPVALLVHNGETLIHGNPEFLKLTGYDTLEALAEVGGLDALLQRQELEAADKAASGMVVVRADDEIVSVTARLQSVRWHNSSALMLALMPTLQDNAAATEEAVAAQIIPLRPERAADQVAGLQVEVTELRAILETATDGVVIIDADGQIRSMNRAASGLFNYDSDDVNGKPFVMLFAHESQKAIMDYLSGLAGHGVASVLNDGREVIGREASGGFLPLFMTIGRLTSSNGYCAVIRDITQWKRTEDELRAAKRAAETANAHKSEFLAHVSHEIRTPLNAIIGFADMMATERFGPIGHPRYIEYANDIGRSGRHVLDIVNDLLDISKIEAGEMDLDFVAVGLNETVSEAVSLVQPQANGQRVIIRTALSHAVPQVVADLRSIRQIVLNILSNAIRFTPSGGQIVVSTAYEANGSVALRIRDTGVGMTRSELEMAMKPFRQVAGAARKRGDGTGLGLPLTKAMVDANRAAFSITSAPNEGTLVEINFPSQRVLAS